MTVRRHTWLVLSLLVACSPGADTAASDPDRGYLIALNSQVIDIRLAPPPVASTPGDDRVLVKFPGPVTAAQLDALAATAQIDAYLPYDTFVVRPLRGAAAMARAAATPALGAAWTGAYRPEYKIAAAAGEIAASAPAGGVTVMATVFGDADLSRVEAAAAALPGAVVVGAQTGARFSRIRLRVDGAALAGATAGLAALGDVFWIDVEGRRTLLNDTTIWVGQSGLDAGMTTPVFDHGIHGEGQVVGYIDTGIDADMCYFRDTARGLPPTNPCNGGTVVDTSQRKVIGVDFLASTECAGGIANTEWDTQGHGSHVAGTIAGDNFANLITHDPGDGMAPGAKLVVQDAGFRTDNCGDLPGIGCPVVDLKPLFQQAYTQGARLHTNSWGDNENGAVQNNYSAASEDVDQFMFDHPDMLILFAAGNSGPGTGSVGSPSTNKNGISVGATLRGTSANSMASFSSCGPTADGRVKPDLTMPGSNIVSARNDTNVTSNNCATTTMSGTSMASPAATGMAALVRQYYTDGFYPTGAKVAANARVPSAALVKATLLNSTQVMTGTGTGPIPNNCQGWGRVLLDNALFFTGQARTLFATDDPGFAQGGSGQTRTFTLQVAAGQPLRVTLAWTDFPSTPAASVNLNNDLDLVVSGPSGTFLGNVFASSQSTTGGTADRRNNVEQVAINAPAAGSYTITVRAFNVPSSAQPFALVASGAVSTGNAPQVVFSDDFETDKGWVVNSAGTDTATTGRWERAVPQATTSTGTKQLGTANSGTHDLVTGATAGAAAGDNDIDGGVTSIQSPAIAIPAGGTVTLSLAFYFAHLNNSSTDDFFRVQIVGATTQTVLQELGSAANDNAAWVTRSVDISAFAGQSVRVVISAADNAGGSLVEAGVDDVVITRQ
ncbi:MAG TPA: S8 family serine peptidase [Kofleriaceae bacterium]|nr:S8 family serine peptidase [Kofleriaceae bacterium]